MEDGLFFQCFFLECYSLHLYELARVWLQILSQLPHFLTQKPWVWTSTCAATICWEGEWIDSPCPALLWLTCSPKGSMHTQGGASMWDLAHFTTAQTLLVTPSSMNDFISIAACITTLVTNCWCIICLGSVCFLHSGSSSVFVCPGSPACKNDLYSWIWPIGGIKEELQEEQPDGSGDA